MFRSRLPRFALVLALAASFAVAGATAARAQTGVWRQIAVPGSGITALARGDSGTVLVANSVGAFVLDGIRARRLPIFSPGPDSLAGKAILQTANGDIWLGTTNHGLFRLRRDGAVQRFTAASGLGNFANDEVLALVQAPDGSIWVGTNLGGLSRFDGTAWTTLTTDHGLPSMTVAALAVNPLDGSLWAGLLGAQAGLVHVVRGAVEQTYDQFALTTSENVQSVLVTRAGLVWVGNDAGIARLAGGAFTEFSAGTTVVSLAEGAHGEIWLGTGNRGVGRWDAGSLRLLPSGPPSSTIRSLLVDPAGVLWTGSPASRAPPGSRIRAATACPARRRCSPPCATCGPRPGGIRSTRRG
jgi:ligand-binding sensor domain-containing protein